MRPLARTLADPALAGVGAVAAADVPTVIAAAGEAGLATITVLPAGGKAALLAALAEALDFPSWYGHNWDALLDCLSDLSWSRARGHVVMLEASETLAAAHPAVFATLLEVGAEAAQRQAQAGYPLWLLLVTDR
ncbi:MAG: barstar family protein [Kofleriaceae bacterium]|nr:barstar family protein [Kofleriaceae bacterium]